MAHPPKPGLRSLAHWHHLQLAPIRHSNTGAPSFNFKNVRWDEFQKFITDHPPPFNEEAQNIHCLARSTSSLLLNAAKASIPFGRLGRLLKAWWCEEAELAVRDRQEGTLWGASFRGLSLTYVEASRRASSLICRAKAKTWQATCNNLPPAQGLALFSTFSTLLWQEGFLPRPRIL